MRITALMIGLALSIAMMVYGASISGDPAYTARAQDAGSVLVLAGFVLICGTFFAYGIPKVTLATAIIAGLLAVFAGPMDAPDGYLFALFCGALAVVCARAVKEQQRAARPADQRHPGNLTS